MKFFKSKKSKVNLEYTIQEENLSNIQKLLLDLGYDLLEIWDHDDGKNYEIWISNDKITEVKLNVIFLERDASRSDIVNEVIDLWFELREINNTLKENLGAWYIETEECIFSNLPDSKEEQLSKFW